MTIHPLLKSIPLIIVYRRGKIPVVLPMKRFIPSVGVRCTMTNSRPFLWTDTVLTVRLAVAVYRLLLLSFLFRVKGF